jgi:hypothetical protein
MLRAYGEPPSKERSPNRFAPSKLELIFDTETTGGPAQRLRFGVYHVRFDGEIQETGIFYHPVEQHKGDINFLKDYASCLVSACDGAD